MQNDSFTFKCLYCLMVFQKHVEFLYSLHSELLTAAADQRQTLMPCAFQHVHEHS